ncbi:MAG: hypothetical protein M3428_00870 [Pseudomonadota bacterium]|nr:hypothetical protein [Sphingomonas sp.]MDQ3470928.1 hypothetical protein [Pseudomonadota bacterium]
MRSLAAAALAFALAACGGGEGEELAAGNSQLSQAQIDAALGPADQSMVQDALPAGNIQNDVALGNEAAAADNSVAAEDEDEQ